MTLTEEENNKKLFTSENMSLGKGIIKQEDLALTEYASSIMQEYSFKTLTDTKEVLVYKDGYYQELGEIIIEQECQKTIPDCTTYKVNQVIAEIQRRTYTDRQLFNNDFSKLVLENGILDLDSITLSKHDPNFLTTIKIPISYDPNARCPKFIKFLKEVIEFPKDIIKIIDSMANILTANRINFEFCLILIGSGGNGKTRLLNIIKGILGENNSSGISIHALNYERFASANLGGKLANIHADISNSEINHLGKFKQAISGERLDVEKKNISSYPIYPFAKHFYSANEMPNLKDDSDATFRRIDIIKFENQFLPGVNRIEDYDKIILSQEKNGIFNLMLQNYKTLLKNKNIRYRQSIAKVREIIKRESDKLKEFIDSCLIKTSDAYLTKDELYQKYVDWCSFKNYEPFSKQGFGVNLPSYGFKDDSKKVLRKTKRVWLDISWNFNDSWVKSYIKQPTLGG